MGGSGGGSSGGGRRRRDERGKHGSEEGGPLSCSEPPRFTNLLKPWFKYPVEPLGCVTFDVLCFLNKHFTASGGNSKYPIKSLYIIFILF